MSLYKRLRKSLDNPQMVKFVLKRRVLPVLKAMKRGHLSLLKGSQVLLEELTGLKIYMRYLSWKSEKGLLLRSIQGSKMFLDPSDPGISRDLLIYGIREETASQAFQKELRALLKVTEGKVVVLELGANIGYYALMEAKVLGNRSKILAFEPDVNNINLLRANIAINGYNDLFNVKHAAVGGEDGKAILALSNHSNLHRILPNGHYLKKNTDSGNKVEVEMYTVKTILAQHNIQNIDVNVIRMDVEGYEAHIFRGMEELIESAGKLLIFLELHCHILDVESRNYILSTLKGGGFHVVSRSSQGGELLEIASLDDLYQYQKSLRLIVKNY